MIWHKRWVILWKPTNRKDLYFNKGGNQDFLNHINPTSVLEIKIKIKYNKLSNFKKLHMTCYKETWKNSLSALNKQNGITIVIWILVVYKNKTLGAFNFKTPLQREYLDRILDLEEPSDAKSLVF